MRNTPEFSSPIYESSIHNRFGTRLALEIEPTYFYVQTDAPNYFRDSVGRLLSSRTCFWRQPAMFGIARNHRQVFLPLLLQVVVCLNGDLGSFCQTLHADEPQSTCELQRATAVPGTLFICGGGLLPNVFVDRFFEIAGGTRHGSSSSPPPTSLPELPTSKCDILGGSSDLTPYSISSTHAIAPRRMIQRSAKS